MKIALCISGFLRNYLHTYKYLYDNILKELNPCVYFYGYTNKDGYDKNINDLIKLYNPKKFELKEYDSLIRDNLNQKYNTFDMSNKRPETDIEKFISQYYNLKQVGLLKCLYEVENNFKYDLIIRSRCDVFYNRKLSDDEITTGLVENNILIPSEWDFSDINGYGVSDTFALCTSNTYNKYITLVDNFESYYKEGCIFHHESMMGYHISKLQLNRIKMISPPFWFESPENIREQERFSY